MIDLRAYGQANSAMATTADMQANLALHHLFVACRYLSKLEQVEQANAGKPFGSFWEEILHSSLGVAALTVMFLDGYADRLCHEAGPASGHELIAGQGKALGTEDILQKYAHALEIRVGKNLDFGLAPVQNVDALIKLRNEVVKLLSNERLNEQELFNRMSEILQDKFKASDFLPGEPVFPRAWASHSFATWALRSTVEFLDYFYAEAGMPSPIAKYKPQLSRLSGYTL